MSVTNMTGNRAKDLVLAAGLKLETMYTTITDNYQIAIDMPPLLFLDPNGGAKDVLMPAVTSDMRGAIFIIVNAADAAEALAIKDSTDTTTFGNVTQNAVGIMVCDGTTWYHGLMS